MSKQTESIQNRLTTLKGELDVVGDINMSMVAARVLELRADLNALKTVTKDKDCDAIALAIDAQLQRIEAIIATLKQAPEAEIAAFDAADLNSSERKGIVRRFADFFSQNKFFSQHKKIKVFAKISTVMAGLVIGGIVGAVACGIAVGIGAVGAVSIMTTGMAIMVIGIAAIGAVLGSIVFGVLLATYLGKALFCGKSDNYAALEAAPENMQPHKQPDTDQLEALKSDAAEMSLAVSRLPLDIEDAVGAPSFSFATFSSEAHSNVIVDPYAALGSDYDTGPGAY